jgi:hypothetical protein
MEDKAKDILADTYSLDLSACYHAYLRKFGTTQEFTNIPQTIEMKANKRNNQVPSFEAPSKPLPLGLWN